VPIVLRKAQRALRKRVLAGEDFSGEDLHGARLDGLDLRFKRFARANLEGANLTESDLSGCVTCAAPTSGPHTSSARG
jgi:uncharacterized protein YjbI with pentapeptide repeats